MDAPVPLDQRKKQILKAVVADYTNTGLPVGSHSLAATLVTWSPATIRNDLANLVEIGLLLQPHASAGRIPSDLGYRYYVDFLMDEELVPPAVRRQIEPRWREVSASVEDILETAARVLVEVTDGVSIVTGPSAVTSSLKHLDLVSLDATHALLLLVLEGNLIRQQPVDLSAPTDQETLSALATTLRRELRGLSAEGVAALVSATVDVDDDCLRLDILRHIVRVMETVDANRASLVVHDGVRNLLDQPEFGDVDRLRQVLDVLEQERILTSVFASLNIDSGVRILIGHENSVQQLSQCSLVVTSYRAGSQRRGTIGVLGPTRMRYWQVAPRVRYVSQRLGEALGRVLG